MREAERFTPDAARRGAPRRRPGATRSRGEGRRHRHHQLRRCCAATPACAQVAVAPRDPRRGPGDQEPADRDRQGRPRAQARSTASPSPARRSRTTSTSCGASWRSRTRGCCRHRSAFENRYADSAEPAARTPTRSARAPAPAHRRVRAAGAPRPTRASSTSCPSASSCATTALLTREQVALYQATARDMRRRGRRR